MRRSGTSSVSQALNRLGVSFGPASELYQADDFNRAGYWEHRGLAGIHRRFRMSLDLNSVECDPAPGDWQERPATEFFLSQAADCIRRSFLTLQGPWAWKDPDASLALPFVYETARRLDFQPFLAICVRNPADTAASESSRRGSPEMETIGAWLAHTLVALHDSTNRPRTIISFSALLRDPRKALEPFTDQFGLRPTEEQWSSAVASVQAGLVHSNSTVDRLSHYPPLVRRVYELCMLEADRPGSTGDELESCWQEFEGMRQMIRRPRLEEALAGAIWHHEGSQQVSQIAYRPTGSWQTVMLSLQAPPATLLSVFLYPLPANIWIRKAAWRLADAEAPAVPLAGTSAVATRQGNLLRLSLVHGPDHFRIVTPPDSGPLALELELLIESGNLVVAETYKRLSEAMRSAGSSSV